MSLVVEIILACSPDTPLDGCDHWPLHDALRSLDSWLSSATSHGSLWRTSGLPPLNFVEDPDVGLRARGVTRALWELVGSGTLVCRQTAGGRTRFELNDRVVHQIRRELLTLSPECAAALQRTGQRFAQNAAMVS
jgi:hypothetical protein